MRISKELFNEYLSVEYDKLFALLDAGLSSKEEIKKIRAEKYKGIIIDKVEINGIIFYSAVGCNTANTDIRAIRRVCGKQAARCEKNNKE